MAFELLGKDGASHQDLMVNSKTVDERAIMAVKLGTMLTRVLDAMAADPVVPGQQWELGSSSGDVFVIEVRRKGK